MFHLSHIRKNRIVPWVAPGLLLLFLVGCSGSKTADEDGAPTQESALEKPSADGSKDKKSSGEKLSKIEKTKLEEARQVEAERKAREEREAEEKRVAEERRLAEERRMAEERYRVEQVRKILGEVQPPPRVSPPEPVLDRSGDPRIVVRSGDLEAAGPLDRPAAQARRERGIQSVRMGGSGSGEMSGEMAAKMSDKMAGSSVQRAEPGVAGAHRRDGMPQAGNMPAGKMPAGKMPADKMPAGVASMAKTRNAPRAAANTMITLVPFESAVPPLPKEPVLRVAVLSDIGQPEKADRVALIIGNYTRQFLENRLGVVVKIAYVAQVERNITRQSVIRYRPKFFRAAVTIAKVLPRDQALSPMTARELSQQDVDLVVYIGRDYR